MHEIPDFDTVGGIHIYRNNACIACNTPRRPDDRLIDLGDAAYIEYEGRLAICSTCLTEANAVLGIASKLTLEKARQREAALQAEVDSLRGQLNATREVLSR